MHVELRTTPPNLPALMRELWRHSGPEYAHFTATDYPSRYGMWFRLNEEPHTIAIGMESLQESAQAFAAAVIQSTWPVSSVESSYDLGSGLSEVRVVRSPHPWFKRRLRGSDQQDVYMHQGIQEAMGFPSKEKTEPLVRGNKSLIDLLYTLGTLPSASDFHVAGQWAVRIQQEEAPVSAPRFPVTRLAKAYVLAPFTKKMVQALDYALGQAKDGFLHQMHWEQGETIDSNRF